jgi:hypothetical protein
VAARGVKEGLVLAADDFAIEIRQGDAMNGRRRRGGHRSPRARQVSLQRQSSQRDQVVAGKSRPTP